MKTYAHVHAGEVIQVLRTDKPITSLFHPDMLWIDVTALDPMPAEGWSAQSSASGWQFAPPATKDNSDGE